MHATAQILLLCKQVNEAERVHDETEEKGMRLDWASPGFAL